MCWFGFNLLVEGDVENQAIVNSLYALCHCLVLCYLVFALGLLLSYHPDVCLFVNSI